MRPALVFLLGLLLCACAAKKPSQPPCEEVFTILPGNFIIDLAAGSEVWLDPANQDFALFCSPAEAQAALKQAAALPGDWRIYKLEETGAEISRPDNGGNLALAARVRVTDWLEAD